MNILYLCGKDIDSSSGVVQKVFEQVGAWKELGEGGAVISLKTLKLYRFDGTFLKSYGGNIQRRHGSGSKIARQLCTLRTIWQNSFFLERIIKELSPDIIYMRYFLWTPFLLRSLKSAPYVVEINSDEKMEFFLRSKITGLYNYLTRNFLLSRAAGLVCVTEELAEKFKSFGLPTSVIGNGIQVKDYPFSLAPHNKRPKLFFIGSPGQNWHGLEKIEFLSKKLHEFEFHIIGVKKEGRANLFYHGYLPFSDAVRIVARADVGISTLSLHYKHMNEACPLKSRQYFAQGLPIIMGYKDVDISQNLPFILKLPNKPSNVEEGLDKIVRFVRRVFNDSEIRSKAREFAIKYLDVEVKEKSRVNFLYKICEASCEY